jgi:hypothetical protein
MMANAVYAAKAKPIENPVPEKVELPTNPIPEQIEKTVVPKGKENVPFGIGGMEKKSVGRNVSPEFDEKPVKFVSEVKAYMLFVNSTYMITFQHRSFVTNDPFEINYLRKHKEFGKHFWEGEMPQWLKDKMEADQKLLTKDPDEYS